MMKIDSENILVQSYEHFRKNAHPSLHIGRAAALLFELSRYSKKPSMVELIKIRDSVQYCFEGISKLYFETSFFVGPLGIIWSYYLCEQVINKRIISQSTIDSILDEYFDTQEKELESSCNVLDYLYGVSGWFIIYPYLSPRHKERLLKLYESQLENFDCETIYYQSRNDQGHIVYQYSKNLLGFAHGLSSICFIIQEYPVDHKFSHLENKILNKINSSYNEHYELSRIYDENDFKRQQWCHGNLGSAIIQRGRIRESLLKYYVNNTGHKSCGVCHGDVQHILLAKISKDVFDFDFPSSEFSHDSILSSQSKFFIQSPLSSLMSIEFSPIRDGSFSWWRLCYPVNRQTLEKT